MADEIEIKLRIPPKGLDSVRSLAWLRAMVDGPVTRKRLRSVYFDTPKFKLRDARVVLRVRHVGRKRLQTVKAEGDGALARKEWECEIKGDRPDLSRLDDTPLARLKKLNLRPVFETVITRTAIPIRNGDSVLEVALDHGAIKTARGREAISEIEIELKTGDPADIVRLAARLAAEVPASYEPRAKAERGYALSAGEAGAAVHAGSVFLKPKATSEEAFRAIGMECLHQVAGNETAVRAANSEGVHQMRVGLRRLRAALSIFQEFLPDEESQAVKTDLKWLTGQLGPARDFEVFVQESVVPLRDAAAEIDVLRQDMERKRDDGYIRACAAVEDERYRKLILNAVFWLTHGAWSTNADARSRRERLALAVASKNLEQRTNAILKKSAKLKKLDPHKRHKLRIAIKNLRYATEFFASLFDNGKARKRQQRLVATLEELQEALGQLNDFTVHQKLAGEVVQRDKHKDRRQEEAFAMGIVTGHEQVKFDACIAAAKKAGGRLKLQRRFWR